MFGKSGWSSWHYANMDNVTDGIGQLIYKYNNCPGPDGAHGFENVLEQFKRWIKILKRDFQRIQANLACLVVSRRLFKEDG